MRILIAGLLLATLVAISHADDPVVADLHLKAQFGSLYDKSTWSRSISLATGWSVVTDPQRKYCLNSEGNSRITLPNTQLATSYTVSVWLKWPVGPYNYAPGILSTDEANDYGVSFDYFSIGGSGMYTNPPVPKSFEVRTTTTATAPSTPGTYSLNNLGASAYDLDTWHHMAVTYDSATRVMTIYQNGAYDISRTQTTTEASNWAGSGALYLGCGSSSGTCYWPFIGCLDDIRIYNTSLTSTQIQTIYDQAAL